LQPGPMQDSAGGAYNTL